MKLRFADSTRNSLDCCSACRRGGLYSSIVSRFNAACVDSCCPARCHTVTTTRRHPTSFKASHQSGFLCGGGGSRQLAITDDTGTGRSSLATTTYPSSHGRCVLLDYRDGPIKIMFNYVTSVFHLLYSIRFRLKYSDLDAAFLINAYLAVRRQLKTVTL